MNFQKNFYSWITMMAFATGCATQGKSIGLGGAIGAGTGSVLGGIVNPGKNGEYRTRNVIIGGAVGAMAGIVAGAAIHENTEREKEISYLKGRESKQNAKNPGIVPALEEPKVKTQWVESKISGNRYVEGHYEYIITGPTRWEEPQ